MEFRRERELCSRRAVLLLKFPVLGVFTRTLKGEVEGPRVCPEDGSRQDGPNHGEGARPPLVHHLTFFSCVAACDQLRG